MTSELQDEMKRQMINLTEALKHDRSVDANARKTATPVKGYLTDKSLHYLHFTILAAENLPIMEENKRANDAYVRCSLFNGDQLVKVAQGNKEQMLCTTVAWDTKKPVWNQDFMFTVPFSYSGEVYLLLEVCDAASVDVSKIIDEFDDDEVRIPEDHVLGAVKFSIIHHGIQVMSPEQEGTDWYFLKNPEGEDVRNNFGILNAVLKGKSSVLKVRHHYTKRPRKSIDDYVVLLQCNVRVCLARRALEREERLVAQQMIRDATLPQFQNRQEVNLAWSQYKKTCKELGTQPVTHVLPQLTSGGVVLSHYSITGPGMTGLLTIFTHMFATSMPSKLTKISLTHMNITSVRLKLLADALAGVADCPLLVLILDGNPLSRDPVDLTQDSSVLTPTANRNNRSTAGALALALILSSVKGLSHLSVANCQLGNAGIVQVAGAVQYHQNLTSLNISDNEVLGRWNFPSVSYTLISYRKEARALTFEDFICFVEYIFPGQWRE